ncbi:ubiquitin protein ligase [Aureococcus anophagefferens]|nr:ubiquitin protein ligase [Aureococcus anophagefferens]
MGAARSVLRRATSIKGSTRERFLLTEEEVEEDAACLEAQRRSIKYCVDNLYYGAPVQLSGVRTPKHHLPSALVAFDAGRGSLGAEMLGDGEQLSSFPASCVVSPTGDIIATAHSLRVTWATRDGDAASELIDKFEVAYRPYLAAASGSPVGWRALAVVDVARGGRRSALVASLEPDAAFEFKCRARNNVGWSAWSPARQFRTSASPPEPPDVPVAGVLRSEAIALWWREPARTFGSPVRTYVLRARRADGPPADGEDESDGGLCDDAPLDGMRRDGGWRVLYAGPLTRFLAFRRAGAFKTPSRAGADDGYAGPENAALLRRGDMWLECWDPVQESVFYFHRLTARRERTAPPEFVELRNESNERRQLGLLSDEDVRADAASQFRLNKRFKIEYDGENGIDSGGLTKDWYLALSHGFADVKFGFFSKTPAGDLELKPSDEQGGRPVDDFKALGRFLAKAVFDQQCVDLPLAAPIYNALRGIGLEEERDAAPAFNSPRRPRPRPLPGGLPPLAPVVRVPPALLAAALDERGDVEVDLRAGRSVAVVERNKHEYVFLVARWRARHATAMEMDALLDGAAEVGVVPDLLRRFSLEELDLLVNGRRDVDVGELEAYCLHQGEGFAPDHAVSLWFWQMMHEFDDDMRARALAFATGSNKIPLDGFSPPLTLTLDPLRVDALPVVHTCFNQIVLSNFTSYATMKKQCAFAIRNCATFELVKLNDWADDVPSRGAARRRERRGAAAGAARLAATTRATTVRRAANGGDGDGESLRDAWDAGVENGKEILARFTNPVVDDQGLIIADALIAGVVAPGLEAIVCTAAGVPLPLWASARSRQWCSRARPRRDGGDVLLGDSPETDMVLLRTLDDLLRDIATEALTLLSWRVARTELSRLDSDPTA